MLLGLFILNSRAQKRVNLVLEVDMTKEGERDARQLHIAGSPFSVRDAFGVVCTHLHLGGGCSREFGDWPVACVLLHLGFHQ